MSWKDTLQEHFGARRPLSRDELAQEFGVTGEAASAAVVEALAVFEIEYGIPVGVLRAADSLDLFTSFPKYRNPVTWLFERAAFEDSVSELNYYLKRRRRDKSSREFVSLSTIGEYVAQCIDG